MLHVPVGDCSDISRAPLQLCSRDNVTATYSRVERSGGRETIDTVGQQEIHN